MARAAKPARLANGRKDAGLCRRERLRAIHRFQRIARSDRLPGLEPRHWPGGRKPGGGHLSQDAGGGAKLPEDEPQHFRHPQPVAGIRMASAMAAWRIRRMNMVSLRPVGAFRVGLFPCAAVANGLALSAQVTPWMFHCRFHLRARNARLERNAHEFRPHRAPVTVPPDGPVSKARKALTVVGIAPI